MFFNPDFDVEDNDRTTRLAPNGKRSNLTDRQYDQVRTPEFKAWFGDWEKEYNIEKLRKSKDIQIHWNGEYSLDRKSARSWMLANLRGLYINKDTGDKMELAREGVRKVTSHGNYNKLHLKSMKGVRELIENSIYITEMEKSQEDKDYDKYRYYVAGVDIDGVKCTAKIVVGVKDGKSYYDHNLSRIEKGSLIDTLRGVNNPSASKATLDAIYDTKLLRILQGGNSSKVVDENGEPLVVYHGTNDNFTEFKESQIGRTDHGWFGRDFYFSSPGAEATENNIAFAKKEASGYGKRVIAAYVNVKKPLITNRADTWTTTDAAARKFSEDAKAKGHDGIIVDDAEGSEIVVFKPNQIKSATDNNGNFDARQNDTRFFNPDFDVEETSLTSGARYSLIKHEEWIKGLTHEAVYTAISNRIDSGIRNGDIRVSSEDDKLKIAIAARTFFAEYSNKIIRLSDGRNLYFAPDPQDIKRGLSKQEAWANYCIHAVTHGGDTVKGRGYPERIFSEEKVDSLMLIEGIVRDENCYAHLNPKHRDKDGVVFVGKDAKGNRMDVVARLDEYGDISADLTEVTAIMKGGKMPPLENIKPLTEVVKEVAIHQAEGYSHLTHNANIIAQSGTESQGDNVQKQTALSGGTSRNQNPAGNELAKKLGIFKPGTRNVDIGAGRFDKATNFLKELGVTNIPFDPVNRSSEENKRNAEAVRKNRAETATVHNVLNVIDNDAVMEGIINQAARAIKPNGTAIFTVYEGDGSGNPKATRDGYQRNAKTAEYIPAIKKYFAKVETRGKVILGKAPKDKGPAFWAFDSNFDNGIRFFNPEFDVEEGAESRLFQGRSNLKNSDNAKFFKDYFKNLPAAQTPSWLKDGSPQYVFKWFINNMVGKEYEFFIPNYGHATLKVNDGHIGRFVCEGPNKGVITKSYSGTWQDAVLRGDIKEKDVNGWDVKRARMLTRLPILLTDFDAVLHEVDKKNEDIFIFIKKFESKNGRPNTIVMKFFKNSGVIGPISTHMKDLTISWLKNKDLILTNEGEVYNRSTNNSANRTPLAWDNAERNSQVSENIISQSGAESQAANDTRFFNPNMDVKSEEEIEANNLIHGVKAIRAYAKAGRRDFATFAKAVATRKPEVYNRIKTSLRGMWNTAIDKGVDLDEVSRDEVKKILADLDAALGNENGESGNKKPEVGNKEPKTETAPRKTETRTAEEIDRTKRVSKAADEQPYIYQVESKRQGLCHKKHITSLMILRIL